MRIVATLVEVQVELSSDHVHEVMTRHPRVTLRVVAELVLCYSVLVFEEEVPFPPLLLFV